MDVDFPVHAACQLNEPTARIRQLVEENDAANGDRGGGGGDDDDQHPPHHTSVLGTKMLGDDNLPLHLACSPQDAHGNPLPLTPSTVSYLMEKHPDALSAVNDDGHAPLHVLLTRRPPLHLVRRALALSPAAARLKSVGGKQLPLHVAVGNNASDEVIEGLYLSYPPAVSKCADRGFLPLHFAAYHGATSYTFRLLLVSNHEALNKKDEYGGDTPLHLLFKAHGDDFGAKYQWLTGRSVSDGGGDGLSLGDSVRLLLRYGATWGTTDPGKVADRARKMVERKNFEGMSVLEVAERCAEVWKIPNEILTILRELMDGNATALDDDDAWAFGGTDVNVEGAGQQQNQSQQANGDASHVARAATVAVTEAADEDEDEQVGGQPEEEEEGETPSAGTATAANGEKPSAGQDNQKEDDDMSIDEPNDDEDDEPVGGIPDGEEEHAPVARDVATNGGTWDGGPGDGKVTGNTTAEDATSNDKPEGEDSPISPVAGPSTDGGRRDVRPDVADDGSSKGLPGQEEEEKAEEVALLAHFAASSANGGGGDGQQDDGNEDAAAATAAAEDEHDDGTSSGRQDDGDTATRFNVSAPNGDVRKGPPRKDGELDARVTTEAECKKSINDTKKTAGKDVNDAVRAAAAERDGQLDASTDDEAAASVYMEGGGDARGPAEDEGEGEARSGVHLGIGVKREKKGSCANGNDLDDASLRGEKDDEATLREEQPAAADGSAGDGKVNAESGQRANQGVDDVHATGDAHVEDKGDIDEKVKEESTDDGESIARPDQGEDLDQDESDQRSGQESDAKVKQESDVNVKEEAKDAESSACSYGRDDGGSVIRGAPAGESAQQSQTSGGNGSMEQATVGTGRTDENPENVQEADAQSGSSKTTDGHHEGDSAIPDQNQTVDTSYDRPAKKESPNARNRGHGKHGRSGNEGRIEFEYKPKGKRPKVPVRFTI